MDELVDSGFLLLGGPLAGDREVMEVFAASSEQEIRTRLDEDPWTPNGMLRITSLEPWTILLDGRN